MIFMHMKYYQPLVLFTPGRTIVKIVITNNYIVIAITAGWFICAVMLKLYTLTCTQVQCLLT